MQTKSHSCYQFGYVRHITWIHGICLVRVQCNSRNGQWMVRNKLVCLPHRRCSCVCPLIESANRGSSVYRADTHVHRFNSDKNQLCLDGKISEFYIFLFSNEKTVRVILKNDVRDSWELPSGRVTLLQRILSSNLLGPKYC